MTLPFPKTLKGRLTIWYLATISTFTLIILAVFGSLLWYTLYNQIDHHIHVVVIEASNIVQSATVERQTDALRNLVSEKGMTAVLVSADGSVTMETNGPEIAAAAETQMLGFLSESHSHVAMMHFTVGDIRFAAVPVKQGLGEGVLAIGYSTQVIRDTMLRMVAIVIGVLVMLLLPFTWLGINLLSRALAPLEEMSQRAASVISSRDLSVRMSDLAMSEELQRIAGSFDKLLERLQQLFASEHAFFSDAAHTLKTPLAVLRSQVETLSKEPVSKKQTLLATIDRAVDTTQDLLLVSRIEGATAESDRTVPLSSICAELGELAMVLGETKHLAVYTDIEPRLQLRADATLLRRALSNIVHNAIAYSPNGGSVTLALSRNAAKQIVFVVTNGGMGISAAETAKIFTRFYRGASSKRTQGSGLGLAISKAVVEQLGGQIEIVSIPHKETRVTVTFPTI